MSLISDFRRLSATLRNKIFLIIGRGIVKALKTDEGTQLIQVVGLKGETISDIERMEEYGFTAVPETDSEATMIFPNGNREQGLIICINDRRYRPTTLASGEVMVYDKNGSKVHLKSDGSIDIESPNMLSAKSASGQTLEDITSITLKTGDAATWMPNILKVDPFSGIPHGGPGAGIVKLKGA